MLKRYFEALIFAIMPSDDTTFFNWFYYTTLLKSVEITKQNSKTRTNIQRYSYSWLSV